MMADATNWSDALGVFFDLWGTLFHYDDEVAATACWREDLKVALRGHGIAVDMTVLRSHTEAFFCSNAPTMGRVSPSAYEARLADLAMKLGHGLSSTALSDIAEKSTRTWVRHVCLDAVARPTLDRLSRTKVLAVVSNFDYPPVIRKLLGHFDVDAFFNSVIVSGEIGFRKPDPRILFLALRHTGLTANQVVYVGDSDEDIGAASAARIRCVRIIRDLSAGDGSRTLADVAVIRDLADLVPLLV
jgi:HAD superfamily hydrolase (TIGR01509 family)